MTLDPKTITLASTLYSINALQLSEDQLEGLIQSGNLESYYEYDVGRRVYRWNRDALLEINKLPMLHPLSPTSLEQSTQNDTIGDNRLTVYGGTLRRGGKLIREVGICAHDGIITAYLGQTAYKTDLAAIAAAGVKTIRVSAGATNDASEWSTNIGPDGTAPLSGYVTAATAFLDECSKNGISCIVTLLWNHNVIPAVVGSGATVADYADTNSTTRAYCRNFVKWWVTQFKDHNAVAGWAIGNEWTNQVGIYKFITTTSNPGVDHETPYLDTVNDLYDTIRSVDKVRAVVAPIGNCSYYVSGDFRNWGARLTNWAGKCEIVSYHYYPDSDTDNADQHFAVGEDMGASDTVLASIRSAALRAGKVLFIEETGAKFDTPPGLKAHSFYDYAFNAGVELVLDWNWYFNPGNAGSPDNLKDIRNSVVRSISSYNAMLTREYRQPLATYPPYGAYYAPSMCFRGTGGYNNHSWISIPMAASVQPQVGSPFLIAFWMRKQSRLAANTRLIACEDGAGGFIISTSFGGNPEHLDVQFAFNGGYSGGIYSGNDPHPVANPGEWHHYCFAWDGASKFTYWFDGLVRVRNTQGAVTSYTPTTRNLFVGATSDGLGSADVDIMDLMIGKVYPTSAEIHDYVTRGAYIAGIDHRWPLQGNAEDLIDSLDGVIGTGATFVNSNIGAGV